MNLPPPTAFAPPIVTWDSPSADATGSMPFGNGDVALNAWVEPSGDLLFYLAKSDTWDDHARLVKIGLVRVRLFPPPVAPGVSFRQELHTATAELVVTFTPPSAAPTVLRLWVDANAGVVHVEVKSPVPVAATAQVELWRTTQETLPSLEISDVHFSHTAPDHQVRPTVIEPDSVVSDASEGVIWYRHNASSHGPAETLAHQNLAGLPGWTDPVLHRTFGALLRSPGASHKGDLALRSAAACTHRFDVHALTLHPASPVEWLAALRAQVAAIEAQDFGVRRAAHDAWWSAFWERSHIVISPTASTTDRAAPAEVSLAYALQRYVTACAGRGAFPIKFNGSLFTVSWPGKPAGPDYRRWGPGYWWQNTRLPYAGALAAGDFDLLAPLINLYSGPLREISVLRAQRHFGFSDALYLPECLYFWGAVFPESYGDTPASERTDKLQDSLWHKREWTSALEVSLLLLDAYAHNGDAEFLRDRVLPFALPALRFFEHYYPVDANGHLRLEPAQALETWWEAVNPMDLVAGLHAVCARLVALPEDAFAPSDRAWLTAFAARLPELPVIEEDGVRRLSPAEHFELCKNSEVPELYAVWPFRVVSFEKSNAPLGLVALEKRAHRGHFGWRQDELFQAHLGLAEAARDTLVQRVRFHDSDQLRGESYPMRFPGFWGPGFDWLPDQCHGGVIQAALQAMLLQNEGDRIFLLPAWPSDWDVTFKLHAPRCTVVAAEVRQGRLVRLEVDPPARHTDVEVPAAFTR